MTLNLSHSRDGQLLSPQPCATTEDCPSRFSLTHICRATHTNIHMATSEQVTGHEVSPFCICQVEVGTEIFFLYFMVKLTQFVIVLVNSMSTITSHTYTVFDDKIIFFNRVLGNCFMD